MAVIVLPTIKCLSQNWLLGNTFTKSVFGGFEDGRLSRMAALRKLFLTFLD